MPLAIPYRTARRAAAVLCVTLCGALATLAHAGRIEDRGNKTIIHVTVFGLPDPSNTDTFNRGEVAGVRAFKKRFPEIFAERYREKYKKNPQKYGRHNWDNVEVELKQFSGIKVEGVETDLLAIAGAMAPDVLYLNFRKSDNYIQNRFLYPLDKQEDGYIGDVSQAEIGERGIIRPDGGRGGSNMTDDELNFRINRKLWPVIYRRGPDGVKHVWALPYGGALGKVLLFRKDLFDEKGIEYPTIDWTWDDMLDASRRITDPSRSLYGMLLARGKHESWYWITFLWSAGGDVMLYNEKRDEWKCTFDTREAAVALDYYTRLSAEKWYEVEKECPQCGPVCGRKDEPFDRCFRCGADLSQVEVKEPEGKLRRGYADKDAQNAYQKWDRGEIGMMLSYIDEKVFATINPEQTGMVPVPMGPTGQRGGELNSRMMSLYSQIEDPAVRDAAWEYMRFYDGEEAVGIKTRIMVEGGLGRFVNPRYLRQFGYPEIERLAPKGWSDTFDVAIATGQPEPYGRNSNLAYNLMTFPIQDTEQLAITDELPADPEGRPESLCEMYRQWLEGYGAAAECKRLDKVHDILKKGCDRANEEMIGIISPKERLKRRSVAVLVLIAIVLTFTWVFRNIISTFTPDPGDVPQGKGLNLPRYGWAFVLLIPAVATILTWQYFPLLKGSKMALFDYRLIGESTFVGVDNFGDLLFDSYFWASVWNSLRYSFLVMSLTFLPPIILAILLQEVPRATLIYRTIYYLPAVITGLVTILLWKQFYEPSENGALNAVVLSLDAWVFVAAGIGLLTFAWIFAWRLLYHDMHLSAIGFALGGLILFLGFGAMAAPILFPNGEPFLTSLAHFFYHVPPGMEDASFLEKVLQGRMFCNTPEPYRWLSNDETAMLACVIPMVWAGMGPGCLIYLAALKGIPDDYFEAADIDGTNFVDKIIHVVFPILKPLIIINFIGVFITSWYTSAGNILVMTGGGAKTEVVGLHIWYKAFTFLKFGPATAMAWVLGFMLIGFTVYQLRILSRLEFRTTGSKED